MKDTLTKVRSRFWLVKGWAFVRKIVRQCVTCKRFEGKPYLGPSPPPLPKFRLMEDPPFSYTGMDFAGPLYIKGGGTANNKTDAIMRHSAWHPTLHIRSGNSTLSELHGGEECLSVCFEWQNGASKRWWEEPWKLTYDELTTLVIEVEAVVNSRPLTYVSTDDFEQPLTPAHLLTGRRLLQWHLLQRICKDIEEDFETTTQLLTKRLTSSWMNSGGDGGLNIYWN